MTEHRNLPAARLAAVNDESAPASQTPSSKLISRLAASVPKWVDLAELDGIVPHGYALPIPAGAANALYAAASDWRAALAPSDAADREKVLRGLRFATILQAGDAREATATLSMLVAHLADVPLDILEQACRAYCNAPGKRFFPKSAGELREFVNPLVAERRGRVFRLTRLAEQAAAEDAERARLAEDPLTPEAIAAIKAEFGLTRDPAAPPAVGAKAARGAPRTPDASFYASQGVDPARAAEIIAEGLGGTPEAEWVERVHLDMHNERHAAAQADQDEEEWMMQRPGLPEAKAA